VTGPGVYELSEADYHAHDSLSSTGARTLIAECPAVYDHHRRYGQPPKAEFDLGACAHTLTLGVGREIIVVAGPPNAPNEWRTDEAKKAVAAARAKGQVPLKPRDFDLARAMADAMRRHPDAAEVFDPHGVAEQSIFWRDEETGVLCRARPDWIGNGITDVKTTTDVSIDHIRKVIADFGYHQSVAWYHDGAVQLDLVKPDAPFRLVFVRKTAPHLVTIVELDETAWEIGRDRNRLARQIYRDCTASGIWPGYSSGIEIVSLPAYVERRHYEET
jgi:PDDEXK-like domain of unknown function (DUF3799)